MNSEKKEKLKKSLTTSTIIEYIKWNITGFLLQIIVVLVYYLFDPASVFSFSAPWLISTLLISNISFVISKKVIFKKER